MADDIHRPRFGWTMARHPSGDISAVLLACFICCLTLLGFCMVSERTLHWFVVPVLVCGILTGIDAADWLLGWIDLFDPVGILGLLGLHFFFLAPLLHVHWDYWMPYVTAPPDWRPWLGGMAMLNVLGLLVYRGSRRLPLLRSPQRPQPVIWRIHRGRFLIAAVLALTAATVLQLLLYARFGGVSGFIASATDVEIRHQSAEGTGWMVLVAESFPIVAMMLLTVYAERSRLLRTWVALGLVLLCFLALRLVFGGLRGSRSTIVWALFWAAGMLHYRIRPLSKPMIGAGCLLLVVFMYLYGFYKEAGLDALQAVHGSQARATLVERTGRDFYSTVLGDLARSDIQAFLLYRLSSPARNYDYAWGKTYLGAVAILIPRSILPDRPPQKVAAGTQAQFGRSSYRPGVWVSARVYGLAGETMLNFGMLAVPLAFVVLGVVVGSVRRLTLTLDRADARFLIVPFLVNMCFIVLIADLDNIIFDSIVSLTVPMTVLAAGSSRLSAARRG